MSLITDPTRTERETAADTTPTPAPTACPACQAPEYKDPLDKLFVRGDGAEWKLYECGARLVFHDVPPVRTEVTSPCTRSLAAAVALRAELTTEKEYSEQARLQCGIVLAKLEASAQACQNILNDDTKLRSQLAEARAELSKEQARLEESEQMAYDFQTERDTLTARLARVTALPDKWERTAQSEFDLFVSGKQFWRDQRRLVWLDCLSELRAALAAPVDAPTNGDEK